MKIERGRGLQVKDSSYLSVAGATKNRGIGGRSHILPKLFALKAESSIVRCNRCDFKRH
ncbi:MULTISPECIES: hypothetical protein [unclassified Microcoleus]|uniref:hypothetical protein n=1 Tax=unclassified Microcoleus TaxID=2642155 RepID=UPI002FD32A2F